MKIIKSTGLVPMTALVDFGNFLEGDIFGALPKAAIKLIRDKKTAEFAYEGGEETEDYVEPSDEAAPVEQAEQQPEAQTDWRKMKHLAKVKFAKDLGYEGDATPDSVKAFLEALDAPVGTDTVVVATIVEADGSGGIIEPPIYRKIGDAETKYA